MLRWSPTLSSMVVERSPGARSGLDDARFLLYLPRVVATWGSTNAGPLVDGTLVFADVTGFTALTERLSKRAASGRNASPRR
jgi:class 3 adenylate cyclase